MKILFIALLLLAGNAFADSDKQTNCKSEAFVYQQAMINRNVGMAPQDAFDSIRSLSVTKASSDALIKKAVNFIYFDQSIQNYSNPMDLLDAVYKICMGKLKPYEPLK